jgi:magnesium chelatase family protein
MLVGAMNPCPCGHLTDANRPCRCTPGQVQHYLARVSGPLLDRIDLHIDMPAVPFDALTAAPASEPSSAIRARIAAAQEARRRRGQPAPNAQLGPKELKAYCELTPDAAALVKSAMQQLQLSARSYAKILKIARTVADLAGSDRLEAAHVAEAIQYRSLDRDVFHR